MTLLFKLIWRDLRANPGRMAVSVFAILVSVSLIVWMMGSYDTLVREFDNDAEAYMGNYDLCLDSAAIGLDNCVELIKKVIELKFDVKAK